MPSSCYLPPQTLEPPPTSPVDPSNETTMELLLKASLSIRRQTSRLHPGLAHRASPHRTLTSAVTSEEGRPKAKLARATCLYHRMPSPHPPRLPLCLSPSSPSSPPYGTTPLSSSPPLLRRYCHSRSQAPLSLSPPCPYLLRLRPTCSRRRQESRGRSTRPPRPSSQSGESFNTCVVNTKTASSETVYPAPHNSPQSPDPHTSNSPNSSESWC